METSFGLLFCLKKPAGFTGVEMPVYLRVTIEGVPKEISVKRKRSADKWSTAPRKMAGKSQEVTDFNLYLDTICQKAFEAKQN